MLCFVWQQVGSDIIHSFSAFESWDAVEIMMATDFETNECTTVEAKVVDRMEELPDNAVVLTVNVSSSLKAGLNLFWSRDI